MSEPLREAALVRPARADAAPPDEPVRLPHAAPVGRGGQESPVLAVLRGLGRRWQFVVVVGFLAAGAAGTIVWNVLPPPVPGAAAKLYMPLKPPTNLGGEHPDPPLERQTQAALVKSRLVLNKAIRPPEVANLPLVKAQEDPLDWLAKKLVVEFAEGPEILRIALVSDDPEQARVLVDAIKDAYLSEIVNKSVTEREDRLRRLDEMTGTALEILKNKRKEYNNLAKDVGSTDAQTTAHQQYFAQQQFEAARTELVKLQSDLRRVQLEEVALKGQTAGAVSLPVAVLDKYADDDDRVRASALARKLLELKLEGIQGKATDAAKTASGQAVLKDLEANRRGHDQLRAKVRAEIDERFKLSTTTELAARLASVREQVAFQKEMEKILVADVERLRQSIKTYRTTHLDLEPLRLEIKHAEDLLGRLRQSATGLKLERDAPPRVIELEKAVVTRVDAERRRMMLAGAGALAAFVAVLAGVGFTEYRLRRVESAEAVTNVLGLRMVGTVPKPPYRWFPWSAGGGDAFEQWVTESISCTRTMLLHSDGLAAHRVIQITSPVSGEGKTTLSCQLAASVALAGRRTLLIDGDLRNLSAHLRFNLPSGPGLCEVLRGEASAPDVVRETTVPGLTLLPAGAWTAETTQALVTAELQTLFELWRDQYDFVIVDSSPVLPVTDPMLLALHADGVIVSLLQGVSRMPLAGETCKRLAALGVRVLGVVLNGTPVRAYGYSKSYFPQPNA